MGRPNTLAVQVDLFDGGTAASIHLTLAGDGFRGAGLLGSRVRRPRVADREGPPGWDGTDLHVVSDDELLPLLTRRREMSDEQLAAVMDAALRAETWHRSPQPFRPGTHLTQEFQALRDAVGPALRATAESLAKRHDSGRPFVDPIAAEQGQRLRDCGCSYPAIRGMNLLPKGMPSRLACRGQRRIGINDVRVNRHDWRRRKQRAQRGQSPAAPTRGEGTAYQLGDSLHGYEHPIAFQRRFPRFDRQALPNRSVSGDEHSAEHVGVQQDSASPRWRHRRIASQNASASSSVSPGMPLRLGPGALARSCSRGTTSPIRASSHVSVAVISAS